MAPGRSQLVEISTVAFVDGGGRFIMSTISLSPGSEVFAHLLKRGSGGTTGLGSAKPAKMRGSTVIGLATARSIGPATFGRYGHSSRRNTLALPEIGSYKKISLIGSTNYQEATPLAT